jgi:hypothetical protein
VLPLITYTAIIWATITAGVPRKQLVPDFVLRSLLLPDIKFVKWRHTSNTCTVVLSIFAKDTRCNLPRAQAHLRGRRKGLVHMVSACANIYRNLSVFYEQARVFTKIAQVKLAVSVMYDDLRIEIREYAEGIQGKYNHPNPWWLTTHAQSVCTRP